MKIFERNNKNRLINFFIDIINGFHDRIPFCCNLRWSLESCFLRDFGVGVERKEIWSKLLGVYNFNFKTFPKYVPCVRCIKKRFYNITGRKINKLEKIKFFKIKPDENKL